MGIWRTFNWGSRPKGMRMENCRNLRLWRQFHGRVVSHTNSFRIRPFQSNSSVLMRVSIWTRCPYPCHNRFSIKWTTTHNNQSCHRYSQAETTTYLASWYRLMIWSFPSRISTPQNMPASIIWQFNFLWVRKNKVKWKGKQSLKRVWPRHESIHRSGTLAI